MSSVTGRIANLLSTRFPKIVHKATRRQIQQFRSSGGANGNQFLGKPTFILDVVGRTSGEPRPVMLMLVRRGEDLVVAGSYAGNPKPPNWWLNLMAAQEATVEIDNDRWIVTAHQLNDGPERDEAWQLLIPGYPDFATYQKLTSRQIPVAILTRVA